MRGSSTEQETKILWSIVVVSFIIVGIFLLVQGIDTSINAFFSALRSDASTEVMIWISRLSETRMSIAVFIASAFFLLLKKRYRATALVAISMAGATFISPWLKELFARARPINEFAGGYGFPSGHTTAAVVLYGSLAIVLWKKNKVLSSILFSVPLLVGISRMYLGVHWFSDVVGGIFFGTVWILMWYLLIYRHEDYSRRKKLKK